MAFSLTKSEDDISAAIIAELIGSNGQGALRFYTKATTVAGVDPVLAMTIDEEQNVIIPTKLTVGENNAAGDALCVLQADKSPLDNLDVFDNYQLLIRHQTSTNSESCGIGFCVDNAGQDVGAVILHQRDGSNSAGSLQFYTRTSTAGSGDPILAVTITRDRAVVLTGRLQGDKGADIASANDITLGDDGNYFDITGTTQINTIAATNWQAGSVIILQFDASVTVAHNTAGTGASILLSGASNFSATADDTLTLVYDGTTWRETARTVI